MKTFKQAFFLLLIVGTIAFAGCGTGTHKVELTSPGRKNSIVFELLNDSARSNAIFYSVRSGETEILENSPFSLEFKGMPSYGHDLKIVGVERHIINEPWEKVWGRNKLVTNHCNEVTITLTERHEPGRTIKLVARAYDDGVAMRYILPDRSGMDTLRLSSENLAFRFTGNDTVWAVDYGGYVSHQEAEFKKMKLSDIGLEVMGMPLLVKINAEKWVAITEADLTDWAGMYISSEKGTPNALVTKLSPHPDEPDVAVTVTTVRQSPWRVIMIADSPGRFLETDLIANLNDPCEISDVSWIRPGKSAWDWWWCNKYAPNAGFKLGSNTQTMKYFIDFASEMGWEYQLVDWYWYGEPFDLKRKESVSNPDADITKMNPDIDIPRLVNYAKSKNVKLLLWLEWGSANKQMDDAFALYEKWGVAGVKVDFMQRDDQQMVNFYHRLVKTAALHHLVVDFHGAYKPTGFSRTYPNMLTREGVMGNEYNKWSKNITPEHKVTLPFTRGILGEMDFTQGSFVNAYVSDFKTEQNFPSPMSMGTRCNQLALMVVYESALQVLCDSPDNYRKSPAGLDFLKAVPTTWDETRVLLAEVGNYITVARKSGTTWYLGSMTGADGRSLTIPMNFLGEGSYVAQIWKDNTDAGAKATDVIVQTRTVTRADLIPAKLAPGGGQVMIVREKVTSDK